MAGAGTYTAKKLAFQAGVPLRTVRFYVQEKLIDAPLGRGRGANFTEHHLVQLQQARTLQNAGFTLDTIRERRGELSVGLKAMEMFDVLHRSWRRGGWTGKKDESDAAGSIHIPMAEGVELIVSNNRSLPNPRQLVEIALHIRKAFGDR